MNSKTNQILLGIIIILGGALAGVMIWRGQSGVPTYHAVYLDTGDLYFGELVTFPRFGLKNIYVLQVGQGEAPISIQKFVDVVWGPKDYIAINRDKVVWSAPLDSTKQLATFIQTGVVAPTDSLLPNIATSTDIQP